MEFLQASSILNICNSLKLFLLFYKTLQYLLYFLIFARVNLFMLFFPTLMLPSIDAHLKTDHLVYNEDVVKYF